MDLIILLPALACWVALARWPIRKVLLNVYLPAALLLPQYYTIRFPHLPPLTFADAAVLPLGAALAVKEIRNWRFAWMDVWVLLFALSFGLSEGLSTVLANGTWRQLFSTDGAPLNTNIGNGGEELFACICTIVLPYMLGKLLIEQQADDGQAARKRVVRRIAQLLAVVAGISVFDFVRRRSLWQIAGRHLFPDQAVEWPVQVRWGFGRIAGPYAHAIIAGMIFLTGLIYCLWLWRFAPYWGRRRIIAGVPMTMRGLIPGAIVAGLLMTQSRGPWVGVGLALVLAVLMRVFPLGRAALIFVVFLGLFTAGAYYYGKRYTDVDLDHARTEAQRDVVYRRLLVRTYMPLVRARKAFGWGYTTLPIQNGQKSIDFGGNRRAAVPSRAAPPRGRGPGAGVCAHHGTAGAGHGADHGLPRRAGGIAVFPDRGLDSRHGAVRSDAGQTDRSAVSVSESIGMRVLFCIASPSAGDSAVPSEVCGG